MPLPARRRATCRHWRGLSPRPVFCAARPRDLTLFVGRDSRGRSFVGLFCLVRAFARTACGPRRPPRAGRRLGLFGRGRLFCVPNPAKKTKNKGRKTNKRDPRPGRPRTLMSSSSAPEAEQQQRHRSAPPDEADAPPPPPPPPPLPPPIKFEANDDDDAAADADDGSNRDSSKSDLILLRPNSEGFVAYSKCFEDW